MRKVVLFTCFAFLMMANRASYGASSLNGVLFLPPLTGEEIAEYKKIGSNEKEIQKFIETRIFVRKAAAFVAELPKGIVYDPDKYGGPQPTANVNMDYALTLDEQLTIYRAFIVCGGGSVTGQDGGFPITGNPGCGLDHPKRFDCGKPVDRNSALSQLVPPANQEELRLFEMANGCPAQEIPRFLATRKYMRQIDMLKAMVPAGKKFDPAKAPPIPELVNQTYFTSGDEALTLMDIQVWQVTHP